MLVLTRKSGEALRIGSDVRIHVLSTGGRQVKLGIEAPTELTVLRDEVYERVATANLDAAAATPAEDEEGR